MGIGNKKSHSANSHRTPHTNISVESLTLSLDSLIICRNAARRAIRRARIQNLRAIIQDKKTKWHAPEHYELWTLENEEYAEEATQMADISITSDHIRKVDKHEPFWDDDNGAGGATTEGAAAGGATAVSA